VTGRVYLGGSSEPDGGPGVLVAGQTGDDLAMVSAVPGPTCVLPV
jgi:hypothetical protein